MARGAQHVYAVVRLDLPDYGSFERIAADPSSWVTVKEILPSPEEAEREVERLNALNSDKNCVYFAQITRLFPGGRAVQPQ